MIKKLKDWMDALKPLSGWDIFFYGLVLVFCYFSFQHSDMAVTGAASFWYLKGDVFNFYEVNEKMFQAKNALNYLPSTYILFGLWNWPVWILKIIKEPVLDIGNLIFWFKGLTTVFLAASAVVLYHIGRVVGLDKKYSILLTAFWVSSPILFFSQFIFGQYDIFTAFFTMLGLLFYLKKNTRLFILFFAVAITFKYFPIFIFIPLLLLVEKKPLAIIRGGALVLVPMVLELIFYMHSQSFIGGVLGFSAATSKFANGFLLDKTITLSVFVVVWFFTCMFAFWKDIQDEDDFIQWALYIPMFVASLIFSVILWHPQWLLFATPFLAITTFKNKKAGFFILLDLMMMFFFIAFTVSSFLPRVDQSLWYGGIFKDVNQNLDNPWITVFMNRFFNTGDSSVWYSLVSSCLLINMVLKFPGTKMNNCQMKFDPEVIDKNWNSIRARFFIGIMIFIIPACISLLSSPAKGPAIYKIVQNDSDTCSPAPVIVKGTVVGQVFKASSSIINIIAVRMATYKRVNTSDLIFRISEYNPQSKSPKVIFEKTQNAKKIKEKKFLFINIKGLNLTPGMQYVFSFETNETNPGNCVTVWRTDKPSRSSDAFAIINNVRQSFDLDFIMFGR